MTDSSSIDEGGLFVSAGRRADLLTAQSNSPRFSTWARHSRHPRVAGSASSTPAVTAAVAAAAAAAAAVMVGAVALDSFGKETDELMEGEGSSSSLCSRPTASCAYRRRIQDMYRLVDSPVGQGEGRQYGIRVFDALYISSTATVVSSSIIV